MGFKGKENIEKFCIFDCHRYIGISKSRSINDARVFRSNTLLLSYIVTIDNDKDEKYKDD